MATKEEYSDQEFDARSLFVNSTSLMQSDTRKGFSQPLNAANGGEFLVNEFTEGHQWSPSVARLVNGNVVVAWDSFDGRQGDASDRAVKARVLDANGNEVVSEFLVNEITSGVQATPAVTALTNGNFAISWMSSVGDGSGGAIRARIFDTGGQEVVGEFPVNQVALGSQTQPAIASLDNGNFVVSWQSQGNPPSYSDIKARVFNANPHRDHSPRRAR